MCADPKSFSKEKEVTKVGGKRRKRFHKSSRFVPSTSQSSKKKEERKRGNQGEPEDVR